MIKKKQADFSALQGDAPIKEDDILTKYVGTIISDH